MKRYRFPEFNREGKGRTGGGGGSTAEHAHGREGETGRKSARKAIRISSVAPGGGKCLRVKCARRTHWQGTARTDRCANLKWYS